MWEPGIEGKENTVKSTNYDKLTILYLFKMSCVCVCPKIILSTSRMRIMGLTLRFEDNRKYAAEVREI